MLVYRKINHVVSELKRQNQLYKHNWLNGVYRNVILHQNMHWNQSD